jgi:hypothetical protein
VRGWGAGPRGADGGRDEVRRRGTYGVGLEGSAIEFIELLSSAITTTSEPVSVSRSRTMSSGRSSSTYILKIYITRVTSYRTVFNRIGSIMSSHGEDGLIE